MTEKRFTLFEDLDIKDKATGKIYPPCLDKGLSALVDLLNQLNEENEQLKNRLKDWHQKTFEAHEYFNILEKVIDEVCNDDISNEIWKEYEKREKLIE